MLSAKEARDIILSSVSLLETELVDLTEAHRRVLGEKILAEENIPPFDNSAMDGFAVRSEDLTTVPIILKIIGEVSAGEVFSRFLKSGEAIRIMTGGQIPPKADAVVQIEWTEPVADNQVRVKRTVSVGQNIRRAGEDVSRGQVVLENGCELRAAELGLLASLGRASVAVFKQPRVAFITTGNELLEIDKPFEPGRIRDSNSYALRALIQESGGIPVDLGIARDTREEIREKLQQGLTSDVLITSGGVSVGAYDLVYEMMREVGVEIKLWKVNIKPGMPFLFGMFRTTPVFGLPGNPVSTMVTFLKFVKPALRKLMGSSSPDRELPLRAELMEDIKKKDGKRHFLRGILDTDNGRLSVRTTGSQSSGVLSSLVMANCLIIIPEEIEFLKRGDLVEVELL